MKKRLLLAAAALLFAVTLSAQPGGMGGFGGPGMGGGMGPGMGGPGMGPGMGGMMTDPFASVRTDIAYDRATELQELLGLDQKQAKKVFKIYDHIDAFIMQEMSKARQDRGEGAPHGEGQGAPHGGFPGMGGGMPGMGAGFPGMGGGMPGMGDGDHEFKMEVIPVSKKEQAWREKQMAKILTPEQFEKWKAYEAEKMSRIPAFGAPGAGFPGGFPGMPGGQGAPGPRN